MKSARTNLRISLGIATSLFLFCSCAPRPKLASDGKSQSNASSTPYDTSTQASQTVAESDEANQKQEEQNSLYAAAASCSRELKVMTYNLKFDNNGNDVNGWEKKDNPRRLRVKAILDKAAPDIIGTQEGRNHQIEDLKGFYKNTYDFWGVGRDNGKKNGEYAGIFYRKSLFKLEKGGHFWLSAKPTQAGTTFSGEKHPRMVSWVRLKEIKSGENYLIVNTHYALNAEARVLSSELIVKQVNSFIQSGDKVMLFGDFNTFEDRKETLILRDKLKLEDSYRLVHKDRSAQEATVNGFKGVVNGRRIDFILTQKDIPVKSSQIIRDSQAGLYSSDHYPVQTNICIK